MVLQQVQCPERYVSKGVPKMWFGSPNDTRKASDVEAFVATCAEHRAPVRRQRLLSDGWCSASATARLPRWSPAPEVKSATVEFQTAALASAAAVLREAGLNDAAGLLEAPAKQLQRVAGRVENTRLGARLDACTAYVHRAERRLVAADKAVKDAEAALETARAQREQLDKELAEGRQKLEQLLK